MRMEAARKVVEAKFGERHGIVTRVAEEYGVSRTVLYRWVAAYQKESGPGAEPHEANHVTPENCEGSRDGRNDTQFSTTNEKEN
ncbi:hypothetical protein [Microcystis phage Mae-JY24]